MRVPKELLEEVIRFSGELKNGPINEMGVLRLALDLQDARRETREAQLDLEHLLSAMEFIRKSGDPDAAFMQGARIMDWAREIGWKP